MSRQAFLDSFFLFLDGLHHLVFAVFDPEKSSNLENDPDIEAGLLVEDENEVDEDEELEGPQHLRHATRTKGGRFSDAQDSIYRVLINLSNLTCLRQVLLPKLFEAFDQLFGQSPPDDSKKLKDAIKELDRRFFEGYLREKNLQLQEVVNRGVV